eukprot:CAMPEP_0181342296 /NCGR_PEP_ID=MMETSP1101-20121128/30917_1 /TAXON_ID=46948 /ORGANISM="Rhodomonas abbreviata, Strain Caron Lab Isolate" /LENGTH=664 /DNA_ID=CAMNT_0023453729 /DNA_START=102 /DNA_END=2096 /DNA_ORIENTATION=+
MLGEERASQASDLLNRGASRRLPLRVACREMQGLGATQSEKLRSIIHEHLHSSNVFGQVRAFVRDFLAQEQGVALDEDKLLAALHEKRIIEELVGSLGKEQTTERLTSRSSHTPGKDRNGRYLHLRVSGGSAFVDQVLESSDSPKGDLVAHFFFHGQRHSTKPVPCCADPQFDDGFLFRLDGMDIETLASIKDNIYIVVVHQSCEDRCSVIGTQSVEWRKLLVTGYLKLVTELSGIGGDSAVPVGVLSLHMEFLPKVATAFKGAEAIAAHLKDEKDKAADKERRFFSMAKLWWKEFLQIRPTHSSRAVKIFARTASDVIVPVFTFVQPLEAGRALKSAGQAARFVSLIEYERSVTLGGNAGRSEVWSDLHTTLASRKGDVEEHAILLCSLLLGFSLEAYCALGTTVSGEPHMWVVTLDRQDPDLLPQATFWESLTGCRYAHGGGTQGGGSGGGGGGVWEDRVPVQQALLFRKRAADDSVQGCRFDLDNFSSWKGMEEQLLKDIASSVSRGTSAPPLIHVPLATESMEEALEASLKQLIVEHRRSDGLATFWDHHLGFLLSPALLSYEAERVNGTAAGVADFHQSIRNTVPNGFSFKGFPLQFSHLSAPRMLQDLIRTPMAAGMISMQGGVDSVQFALRVHVTAYPERVCSVWVMLAVVFAKIDQ